MKTFCVFVCVCVGLYIPAIVDRHRDFYMQTWTFVNRGRPRILEEVHQTADRIRMHLKRCYIFRVYSRGREVHGWIVPYHIQVRVYLSSPRLPYIFLVCVSSVRGIKTGYEKKGRVHVRRYIIQVCVCVCVCVARATERIFIEHYNVKKDTNGARANNITNGLKGKFPQTTMWIG